MGGMKLSHCGKPWAGLLQAYGHSIVISLCISSVFLLAQIRLTALGNSIVPENFLCKAHRRPCVWEHNSTSALYLSITLH